MTRCRSAPACPPIMPAAVALAAAFLIGLPELGRLPQLLWLLEVLDPTHPIGIPYSTARKAGGEKRSMGIPCYDYFMEVKQKYPRCVALVKVGGGAACRAAREGLGLGIGERDGRAAERGAQVGGRGGETEVVMQQWGRAELTAAWGGG
eukprot:73289-Chlamydomonas_euryale.AAC.5